MPPPVDLDYAGVLSALQGMLGQRVTVLVSAAPAKARMVASFSGELHRVQVEDDMAIVVVGGKRDRGLGQVVLEEDALERATLSDLAGGPAFSVITAGLRIQVNSGHFTALLEEQ